MNKGPHGRKLTGEISDQYCENLNINANTAPSGAGFDYADNSYPISLPCTDGTNNCPMGGSDTAEYTGSIFALGNDAVSFAGGKGTMKRRGRV